MADKTYIKRHSCDRNERRENALRPSRHLGYDHDILGLHLLSREAYEIVACCFRRAVWLNPFEPAFKEHLAFCLHKLEQNAKVFNRLDNEKVGNPDE